MSTQKIPPSQARKILWTRGVLRWKLHDLQKKIYDHFYNTNDTLTMLISRQSGKSFLMCLLSIEACLRKEKTIVKYVCQTRDMLSNIVIPNVEQICEDCPDNLKPVWYENKKRYIFPNGSEIQIAGSDGGHYNKIRGGKCHLWIVDEAGFCSDLETIVDSVLKPTTTTTKGRGILASTPDPDKPDHEFVSFYCPAAELLGSLFKATIHDNPLIDEAERNRIIGDYPGGVTNPRFRAEYLCEIVRNPESIVIPEFDDDASKEIINDTYTRPPLYDTYVSMDIGGKDFTVLLFGYYDFTKATIVIEDEIVLKEKQNTGTIARELKNKINTLWDGIKPYQMYADNNNVILLNTLQLQHQLNFIPTRKDNKEAAINTLRLRVQDRKITIHPRCKTLIYHLKAATWVKKSTGGYKTFARGTDKSHYDALDSLIYFVRNVHTSKSPYPHGYDLPSLENAYIRPKAMEQKKEFLKIVPNRGRRLTNR